MKKTFFVIAVVFLVVAIAVPIAIFAYNNNLNNSNIIVTNPNGQVTGGNTTLNQGPSTVQGISNTVPLAIGIFFFSLFVLSSYMGLRCKKKEAVCEGGSL